MSDVLGRCKAGCRCRCGQQSCGCRSATGVTADGCALGSAGIRCRMCNGPARVQRVESALRGNPIGLIWCPRCDVPAPVPPPP